MTALFGLALLLWLIAPWDKESWRIQPPAPFSSAPPLRVYALLQLATGLPSSLPLPALNMQSRFGTLFISYQRDGLHIACSPCRTLLPAISREMLTVSNLALTLQRTENHLTGKLIADGVAISYEADFDQHGARVHWQLPSTPVNTLTQPLRHASTMVRRAKINGLLKASGTIHLPTLAWSVAPEIHGLSVSGLGTSTLRTAEIRYRCPSKPLAGMPLPYTWLQAKEMGRWLPKAVIIAEDAQFKHHQGFDLQAIQSILAKGERIQKLGGSTITQQLAKNFFTGGERTVVRKLEELLYAVEMEKTLGKQFIFGLYLNTVEWGPGICGASQAAAVYFKKKPDQLSPAQAAWLASILKNPHRAWIQQFLASKPDIDRTRWILGFMPKSAKKRGANIVFANR